MSCETRNTSNEQTGKVDGTWDGSRSNMEVYETAVAPIEKGDPGACVDVRAVSAPLRKRRGGFHVTGCIVLSEYE
jgi:hypothetical protein